MSAAIGNRPRLIEDRQNLLLEWDIDPKQRNVRSDRNALGIKGDTLYLVIVHRATLPDLADVLVGMGMDHALNLDGGYSSALWYNDEYMVGPGRNIPNAIMFTRR